MKRTKKVRKFNEVEFWQIGLMGLPCCENLDGYKTGKE